VITNDYRARCLSYEIVAPSACDDSLRVEFGKAAVLPTIKIPPYRPDLVDPTRHVAIPVKPRR
jgi:hypothetical protein